MINNIEKNNSIDKTGDNNNGENIIGLDLVHQTERKLQNSSSKDRDEIYNNNFNNNNDNNNNNNNSNHSNEIDNLEDIELQNITTTSTSTAGRIGLSHIHDPKNRIR